jgi:hypothetical protein
MKLDYPYHTPVFSTDNEEVGLAVRWYQRGEGSESLDPNSESLYLKVVDYRLGDDIYLPASIIDERSSQSSKMLLTETLERVYKLTLSRIPRFIAYGAYEDVALAQPA